MQAEFVGASNRETQIGNVLLDSGSQISIIRQAVADDLGLIGKNTAVTIRKVGGQKELVQTQVYNVPIRSLDTKNESIISAISLPYICDIIDTPLSEEATQLNLKPEEFHRGSGPVDILVGIDHIEMHSGETRKGRTCAARKSPLGWIVFGSSKLNVHSPNTNVLHVQLSAKPELWRSKEIGVKNSELSTCESVPGYVNQDDVSPGIASEELLESKELSSESELDTEQSKVNQASGAEFAGDSLTDSFDFVQSGLDNVARCRIQKAQSSLHEQLKLGEFEDLRPFVDDHIIRVQNGGRVEGGEESYEQRNPVLLPQSHFVSTNIVRHIHEKGHEGVASVVDKVKHRYCILGVQKLAKTVEHRCLLCKCMEHKLETLSKRCKFTLRKSICSESYDERVIHMSD